MKTRKNNLHYDRSFKKKTQNKTQKQMRDIKEVKSRRKIIRTIQINRKQKQKTSIKFIPYKRTRILC